MDTLCGSQSDACLYYPSTYSLRQPPVPSFVHGKECILSSEDSYWGKFEVKDIKSKQCSMLWFANGLKIEALKTIPSLKLRLM